MDKEHAKFILQSYRPDGADASNPDFTEALQLAAEDRELGLWLAQERAHDAVFVEALGSVDIPDALRDEIFSVMEHDAGGKDLSSDLDALFVGAMAHVSPPEGLRDQILSAMEVERNTSSSPEAVVAVETLPDKVVKFPMRWLNLAAIAAVVVLGATFIYPSLTGSGKVDNLNIADVQLESGKILNASHEVEVPNDTLAGVNTWLASEGMPEAVTVPRGLIALDVKGGRKLTLDNGVQASVVFFEKKGGLEYYLMVLKVDSVKDAQKLVDITEVKLRNCSSCPVTHFNVTAWKDETKAYLLLSNSEHKEMAELF